jgi:hypothetical protein
VPPARLVDFTGAPALGAATVAVSLHAHTNRSREGTGVVPPYLERIPLVWPMVRRELRAYEERNHEPVDFSKGWWHPPMDPAAVLASERSQIADRLGLHPMVSITDHDNIDAPLALRSSDAVRDDVPLSVEWTVPFERGFLHLGVHNLSPAHGEQTFHALSAYTRQRDLRGLTELLKLLSSDPETLVVLNHPMWDLAGIGAADHALLVRRFLREYRGQVHALEINGYRSWSENLGAIALAEAASLPIVSGGDRHGCAPNALLNLTTATSFGEFVREVREELRSVVLVMPEYREPLISRKLATVSDALREYPSSAPGHRRWLERVGYERDGEIQRLSEHWPGRPPWWVRGATCAFEIATSTPLLPVLRLLVWLAGASTSHRSVTDRERRRVRASAAHAGTVVKRRADDGWRPHAARGSVHRLDSEL